MVRFSLLQKTLEQTISREALEACVGVTRSIRKIDCPAIHRDLFGIVASGLESDEANALHVELLKYGYPTEVVADRSIPALHDAFPIQRLEIRGAFLVFTDTMSRERLRPVSDAVFLGGGFLNRTGWKVTEKQRWTGKKNGYLGFETERSVKEETFEEFRLDFFFWTEPNRYRIQMSKDSVFFYQGNLMRPRHVGELTTLVSDLCRLVPEQRRNRGLNYWEDRIQYPSPGAYEEEIRWHFHQLKSHS